LNTTTNKSKETNKAARENNGESKQWNGDSWRVFDVLTLSAVQKLHHTFRPKIITQNSAFLDQEQFF